jgi:undecaprenyl diphosphate synthase
MSEALRASGLRHLAIIMDGNRRWARKQRLPLIAGHEQGVQALRRTVLYANSLGLRVLTVYAFSTENWQRPLVEVNGLMDLFFDSLEELVPELHENGVRLHIFGDLSQLSAKLQERIQEAEKLTRHNPNLLVQVAMNYGSRRELVRACK